MKPLTNLVRIKSLDQLTSEKSILDNSTKILRNLLEKCEYLRALRIVEITFAKNCIQGLVVLSTQVDLEIEDLQRTLKEGEVK